MVSIHGASAHYKVLSAEKIDMRVPARATSGLVRVTAGSVTATSPKILPLTATVTSFTPTSGGVGTAVTVNGTGSLTWILNGRTVSANASSPACKTNPVPIVAPQTLLGLAVGGAGVGFVARRRRRALAAVVRAAGVMP